jgi:hypothetical protein
MISIEGAVRIVVYLIVCGAIFGLLWYAIGIFKFGEPFDRIARGVLVLLAILVIIGILLSLVGGGPVFRP